MSNAVVNDDMMNAELKQVPWAKATPRPFSPPIHLKKNRRLDDAPLTPPRKAGRLFGPVIAAEGAVFVQ